MLDFGHLINLQTAVSSREADSALFSTQLSENQLRELYDRANSNPDKPTEKIPYTIRQAYLLDGPKPEDYLKQLQKEGYIKKNALRFSENFCLDDLIVSPLNALIHFHHHWTVELKTGVDFVLLHLIELTSNGLTLGDKANEFLVVKEAVYNTGTRRKKTLEEQLKLSKTHDIKTPYNLKTEDFNETPKNMEPIAMSLVVNDQLVKKREGTKPTDTNVAEAVRFLILLFNIDRISKFMPSNDLLNMSELQKLSSDALFAISDDLLFYFPLNDDFARFMDLCILKWLSRKYDILHEARVQKSIEVASGDEVNLLDNLQEFIKKESLRDVKAVFRLPVINNDNEIIEIWDKLKAYSGMTEKLDEFEKQIMSLSAITEIMSAKQSSDRSAQQQTVFTVLLALLALSSFYADLDNALAFFGLNIPLWLATGPGILIFIVAVWSLIDFWPVLKKNIMWSLKDFLPVVKKNIRG